MDKDIKKTIRRYLDFTRGEVEIFIYLARNYRGGLWYSSQSICSALNFDLTTAQRNLKTLREKGFVERTQKNNPHQCGGGYIFYYRLKDQSILKKLIHDLQKKEEKKLNKVFQDLKMELLING